MYQNYYPPPPKKKTDDNCSHTRHIKKWLQIQYQTDKRKKKKKKRKASTMCSNDRDNERSVTGYLRLVSPPAKNGHTTSKNIKHHRQKLMKRKIKKREVSTRQLVNIEKKVAYALSVP